MRDLNSSGPSGLTDRLCVQLGDVWRLGRHRLVCGDATDMRVVRRALGGSAPKLMVTDPPYGVGYDPSWRCIVDEIRGRATRHALGVVTNDHKADWRQAWALFPGDVAYVWHSAKHAADVAFGLMASGFEIRAQIIWDKGRLVLSRGHYHWRHEPCWYAVRKGRTAGWTGDRKQTTVWLVPHRRSDSGHAAQKPFECMRRPIENHSRPGDAVYDPFLGSGTTLLAAEATGRACRAIEIEPGYVALATGRWQEMTGRRARLLSRSDQAC